MTHFAQEAAHAATLLFLLVLTFAMVSFSYSLGYSTGARDSDERLGRQMEEMFRGRDAPPAFGEGDEDHGSGPAVRRCPPGTNP